MKMNFKADNLVTKTLKVSVKDKHAKLLSKQAASVTFVWNYINELSCRSIKKRRAIHAKIANRRKDEHHKLTSQLVQENAAVFVGNVSSKSLTQTKMAKSVLDAGWGQFKTILEYKCAHAGVVFEEINESYTTQTCSCCRVISISSPKGRAGLGMREWTCVECGTFHDRDINAARNILARRSLSVLPKESATIAASRFSSGRKSIQPEKPRQDH